MKWNRLFGRASLVVLLFLFTNLCQSQTQETPPHDASDLAKATQNPVSNIVSIPFQFNFNSGGGFEDKTFFNLNIQPVIPFKVSEDWNLIARTIVPVVSIPVEELRSSGIGDIQEQLFLSPSKPGGIIWGFGPIFSLPTATADVSRTGSWAAGPNALLLKMTGPWVLGVLANQLWTFSDEGDDPEVNQLLIQYFVNYNFGKGWAITTGPSITANWDAPDGEEWTVPVGIGISRTTVLAKRPMTVGIQYYRNVEHPSGAAADTIRFIVSLIYPGGH